MRAGLKVVRHPRARRAKLAVDRVSGEVRLTLPVRASLRRALEWVDTQGAWIAEQRATVPAAAPFMPGAQLPLDGGTLELAWREGPRTPVREGDQLVLGGPLDTYGARVTRWLRYHALEVLARDTAAIAMRAGVSVPRVTVGDARGRWGSCSSAGAIRYSWRLVLAPPDVRRAVVAHEVAHRVHMNHGPSFHTLAEQLNGADPGAAMAWLRTHGAGLHGYGRNSSLR